MHRRIHTYVFWKGIHSQLSISTRIYRKQYGGQMTHFLLLAGSICGGEKKKEETQNNLN